MNEDKKYFNAADTESKDSKLNKEEFEAFQNPEHFEHMHKALIEVIKKICAKNYFFKKFFLILNETLRNFIFYRTHYWKKM